MCMMVEGYANQYARAQRHTKVKEWEKFTNMREKKTEYWKFETKQGREEGGDEEVLQEE